MIFKWLLWRNNALVFSFASNSGKQHQKCRRWNMGLLLWPSSSLRRKTHPFPVKENKASQAEHEEHIGDLFDSESIVHQDRVRLGLMVNQQYYWDDLPQLRKQVCWKHLSDGITKNEWKFTGPHCFVITSISGYWKHSCVLPPSWLPWLGLLWVLNFA